MSFRKLLRSTVIFVIVFTWIFSGWPPLWKSPRFPPAVPYAYAVTDTLQAQGDSWIDASSVNANKGNATTMQLRRWTAGFIKRGIIKFALTAIPASATISSATLKLVIDSNSGHAKTVDIHKVQQSPARNWTEGNGTDNSGVTWNRYDGTNSWTAAGGDFASTASASASVGAFDAAGTVKSFTVTSDVQDFYTTSSTNFGWIAKLSSDSSGAGEFVNFGAKEHATSARRPTLEVTYTVPTFTQSVYRFFSNADSTDVGGALAAQDAVAALSSAGQAFRLRMLLHVAASDLLASGINFKLQYVGKGTGTCASPSGGTPASYTDVTGATLIAYNNNTPADGASLTENGNDPTHNADTIKPQTYEEANNFTNSVSSVPSGQDGKWDFALVDNSAPGSTAYCFRIVKSDDTALDTYSVYPQITTATAGQTLTFSLSDNSIGFGALSSSAARFATGDTLGSGSETEAHTLSASTNASSGYVITVDGTTLTKDVYTVTAIGASNTASSTGTEQFGIRLAVNSGDGTVTAPYAAAGFALDTAAFPDQAASGTGNGTTTVFSARYLANISATTESGSYTATLTYVATGTF